MRWPWGKVVKKDTTVDWVISFNDWSIGSEYPITMSEVVGVIKDGVIITSNGEIPFDNSIHNVAYEEVYKKYIRSDVLTGVGTYTTSREAQKEADRWTGHMVRLIATLKPVKGYTINGSDCSRS